MSNDIHDNLPSTEIMPNLTIHYSPPACVRSGHRMAGRLTIHH